jgi:outer membrane protein assembly factor BamB
MRMKRSSFVCLGAAGSKDSLVYQEIPGREGGEEFFLFFAAGSPLQESLLRTLFREAVSASRLGAPYHYFLKFIERFASLVAEAGTGDDPLVNALLLIQIRRGDDVHVLCNRDALLLHWDGALGAETRIDSLPGFIELPLGGPSDQRDLFRRSPADLFCLFHFTAADDHTLALVPSREFAERHTEAFRNCIFFPAFEIPQEAGLELPIERSIPVLHWRAGGCEKARMAIEAAGEHRRMRKPIAAAAAVAIAAVAAVVAFRAVGDRHAGGGDRAMLVAADVQGNGAAERTPGGTGNAAGASGAEAVSLAEAWASSYRAPVTSSPLVRDGMVFFGCRDGYLYACDAEGKLTWKYKAAGGIGASPLCVDDRIICADYSGQIFCLARESGSVKWRLRSGSKIVSSPIAAGNAVYAATTDGRVVAARLGDGSRLWQKKIGASIRATGAAGRNYVVAATTDGIVAKLDAAGSILWKVSIGGEIISSPACIEERGIVVLGGPDGAVHALSLATGESVWRFAAGSPVTGSPRVDEGVIYIGARNGSVYAIDLDGNERWHRDIGGAVLSKPLVTAGFVFITTYGSQLVALDTEAGTIIGRYRAGSPIYSSPASDGKRVYFGSNGGVFHALWLAPPA